MGEVSLSYSAEELVAFLEDAVRGSAPPARWLSVLAGHEPELARDAAGGDVAAVVGAADPSGAPLTRTQVADRACRRAEQQRAPVAKAAHVAEALVELTRESVAAPPPAAPPAVVPTGRTRTFRVFVSSTFEDFAVERNVLRAQVWPALRDLCRQYGARFQPIDLRWGISDEAALDQQTMNICLGEIDRCQQVTPRPDFLVLLGNRYGWRPPPPQIPESEYERLRSWLEERGATTVEDLRRWYRLDLNADPPEYRLLRRTGPAVDPDVWRGVESRLVAALGAAALGEQRLTDEARRRYHYSATAQEVARGALEVAEPDQAIAFIREIEAPAGVPEDDVLGDVRAKFVDDDQSALSDLKDQLRRRLGDRVVTAPPLALGRSGPEHDADWLATFARRVHDALARSIRAELEHPHPAAGTAPALDPLDEEVRAHRTFAAERRAHFTGRGAVLAQIAGFVGGTDPRPLVVHGGGGTGKSAVMAEALRLLEEDGGDALVLARFVGATPDSSDGRALLASLCEELAREMPGDDRAVPSSFTDLVADLARRLAAVGSRRPVRVLVDSLDQLSGPARSLAWVPRVLPPGTRMLLSTRPGPTLEPLRDRALLLELGGLTRDDGSALLRAWLGARSPRRTVQPRQADAVLDAFVASEGNPLYLRLATEEARRWVAASEEEEPPERLAVGVRELIRGNLLDRLASEDNHGHELVRTALGYLAAAREGLTEDELTDLLSRDLPLYRHVLLHAYHVPEDLVDGAATSPLRPADEDAAGWLARLRREALAGNGEALDAFLASVVPAGAHRPRPGPELPVVLWSRLSFDLAPYLTERRTDDGSLLAFYHPELRDVAAEEYLAGDAGAALHGRLADYFRELADPRGDASWTGEGAPGRRGLGELPHHLTRAERWDDVTGVLTDFTFLEQKATYVGVVERPGGEPLYTGVFALEADYDEALDAMGRPEAERPRVIVTAVDLGAGLVLRCPHCNTVHRFDPAWRGKDIACPGPACGGPLRVNDFVVERH